MRKNVAKLKNFNATGKVSTLSREFRRYRRNIYAERIYSKQNHSFKKYQLCEKFYLLIFPIFDEIIAFFWEKKSFKKYYLEGMFIFQ